MNDRGEALRAKAASMIAKANIVREATGAMAGARQPNVILSPTPTQPSAGSSPNSSPRASKKEFQQKGLKQEPILQEFALLAMSRVARLLTASPKELLATHQ